jgi:hypothetical protein
MGTVRFRWILVILGVATFAVADHAQSSGPDLHHEILQVYDFQPHALSSAQIAQKSAALDQFWSKAKTQSAIYIPGLRKELSDFSNPPFFLYDGSKLLLSLSPAPSDRKLVLAAISHSDLRDVQFRDYFMLVHSMADEGEDTTTASFHILEEPKFQVFIPQHALTLGQDTCLIYMLLPTNQDFWIHRAIERLGTETDLTAQKSLLLLLFYAQMPEADRAIIGFSNDATKPQAAKTYANELIHRKDGVSAADRAAVLLTSEESLRQARRERMKAVSDEALDDLDTYTAKIIAKRR